MNAQTTITTLRPEHFETALPALSDMLCRSVALGASIGWPSTPTRQVADTFWRGCIAAAEAGERVFFVALADAADPASVIGSTQLVLAAMPNGRHRGEVMKVMVHPRARRHGVAQALMRRAETEALQRGKRLLVLDTLKNSEAERLYTRLGWQLCGRIPDYAELEDGRCEATTVMFKRLHPGGLQVRREPHDSADARALQDALSAQLLARYASSGQAGFADFDPAHGAFVVARDAQGRAVGCGALRPLPERGPRCAELKRLYAAEGRQGVGRAVLQFLEHEAALLGFAELALETRHANTGALAFYRAHGYAPIDNYGRYAGRPESACLARLL